MHQVLQLRPVELIYIQMHAGGCTNANVKYIEKKAEMVKNNPALFIQLVTAYNSIGEKTEWYTEMIYPEMKIDLDILQLLGYVPCTVRAAYIIFQLLNERIPDIEPIFNRYATEKWHYYIPSNRDYVAGRDNFLWKFNNRSMKNQSVQNIIHADRLYIRIHHILCMTCFMEKGDGTGPISEDNLFEFWYAVKSRPNIPVTVTEGCEQCMICPPCSFFDRVNKKCVSQGALRDRKKDLDVFQILDLHPGDTLPAKELLKLVYNRITTVEGICDYGKETLPEWKACQGQNKYGEYTLGRSYIKKVLSI